MKTDLKHNTPIHQSNYELLIVILLTLGVIGLIAMGIFYPLVDWLSSIGQSHVTMQDAQ